MVTIKVNRLLLRCDDNAVVYKGSIDYDVYLKFELDSTWAGNISATFVSGSSVVTRELSSDGTVLIPSEVIEPPYFSVSIFTSELSSNAVSVRVKKSFDSCGCTNNVTQRADQDATYTDIQKLIKSMIGDSRSDMMAIISKNNAAVGQDLANLSARIDERLAAIESNHTADMQGIQQTLQSLKADIESNLLNIRGLSTRIDAHENNFSTYKDSIAERLDSIDLSIEDNATNISTISDSLKALSTTVDANREQCDSNLEKATAIAKGRSTGYVFDTKADLDAWLALEENTSNLVLGDNLYIRDVGVPDMWWDGSAAYQLETQKVDLSPYKPYADIVGEFASKLELADVNDAISSLKAKQSELKLYTDGKCNAERAYVDKYKQRCIASWYITELVSGITADLAIQLYYPLSVKKYALCVNGTPVTDITDIGQNTRVASQVMSSNNCGINFYTSDNILVMQTDCESTIYNGGICLVKE